MRQGQSSRRMGTVHFKLYPNAFRIHVIVSIDSKALEMALVRALHGWRSGCCRAQWVRSGEDVTGTSTLLVAAKLFQKPPIADHFGVNSFPSLCLSNRP